ncbi:class IV adenylate cyclase [Streptomyces harbinensis]|uniref:class IV adenylate cyclase n=1 Tax=Streptomyces harbinensis TaxID=1176198 RepID=UPI002176B1F2
MPTIEYEAKVLEIETSAMAATIERLGGKHLGTRRMRRYVYDLIPPVAGQWIRLRTDGDTTTLCVKEIQSDAVDGTHETETAVTDFDGTHAVLLAMGFAARGYQENLRSSYLLAGARLEIDTWPLIPPYLEIEGDSEDHVLSTAQHLGISVESLVYLNTQDVYRHYGHDLKAIKELRLPD